VGSFAVDARGVGGSPPCGDEAIRRLVEQGRQEAQDRPTVTRGRATAEESDAGTGDAKQPVADATARELNRRQILRSAGLGSILGLVPLVARQRDHAHLGAGLAPSLRMRLAAASSPYPFTGSAATDVGFSALVDGDANPRW